MTETKTLSVADGVASLLAVQNPEPKAGDQEKPQETTADEPEQDDAESAVEEGDGSGSGGGSPPDDEGPAGSEED